ncbi:hypothetical protein [Oryzobacter telluris]|uniref:hypothetical protein n=1 Tax=Oryzobacter telluris TaxID=3149179 RepID=UPI00370D0E5C
MDVTTARDVARVRARAAAGGAVLSGVLGVGAGAFAVSAPEGARAVLVAACVLGVVSGLGCVVVLVANRALAEDPVARGPRSLASSVVAGALLAWVVTVAAVTIGTGELAWALSALGLVVVVMPAVVLAAITIKGPHPT